MILIGVLIYGFISFLIGEFFGRAKHIGRWWTMFLFWSTPIPIIGILALVLSPSAKDSNITKHNKIWLGIGILFLGLSIIPLINIFNSNGFKLHFSYIYFTTFIIHGIYFILLSYNKISNHNPKYYFNRIKSIKQTDTFKIKTPNIFINSNSDAFYFIMVNNEQKGPYNFEELKKLRVTSNTLIWRKGLKDWVKAEHLGELENIIVFLPPPLKEKNIEDNNDKSEDESIVNVNASESQKNPIDSTNNFVNEDKLETIKKEPKIDEKTDRLKGLRIFAYIIVIIFSVVSIIPNYILIANIYYADFNTSLTIYILLILLFICEYISISNSIRIIKNWEKNKFNLISSIIDDSLDKVGKIIIGIIAYCFIFLLLYAAGAMWHV